MPSPQRQRKQWDSVSIIMWQEQSVYLVGKSIRFGQCEAEGDKVKPLALAGILALVLLPTAAFAAQVTFTSGPSTERVGEMVRISFAVSAPTDVAVYIENAEGKIVRHLVAGVLGDNPPEPLARGKLEQSLMWDRKDDLERPLPAGRYRVRVAAGLRAAYAGAAFSERTGPDNIANVIGLACGPDGRVYVLSNRWQRIWWTATAVHVFLPSGAYEKTIKPFPSNLPPERLRAIQALEGGDGRVLPVIHRVLAMSFYPYEDISQQMAVTPDGHLHMVVVPAVYRKPPVKRLATIDSQGGMPYEEYAGERLLESAAAGQVYLAPASNGKAVYLTGLGRIRSGSGSTNPPVVYQVKLPERGSAQPFFGDPEVVGTDQVHLNDPCGLATDGKGHLLVADRGNNRVVVVREKDGKFAASFPVPAPSWVGVHHKSGAVYVCSGGGLIKFSGWKEPRELARLQLPPVAEKLRARTHWFFALDYQADPAVLWIGRDRGSDPLLRCVDRGDQFSVPEPAGGYPSRTYWNLSVGQQRREVACREGGQWEGALVILDEETGTVRRLTGLLNQGRTFRLGPNGQIYGMDHWHANGIRRWDRQGRDLPFAATVEDQTLKGRLPNIPSGTTSWERDFCVDRAGNIYVKQRGVRYHGRMRIDEYDGDGNFKRTAIWVTSDGALGPRIDLAGNLYLAECIKPLDKPYPDDFQDRLPSSYARRQYTWMYGSVIKFSPKGGAVWFPILDQNDEYAFKGEAELDPTLAKEEVSSVRDGRMVRQPALLQGALWWRFGCSFLLDMHISHNKRCHCTATDFDVDDFGRVFYPDQGRFRIEVLDTNGNRMLKFGGYGNQDCWGADSYVWDAEGKFYRPRREDDPRGLVSPFAKPDIAFAWIIGVAASDKYVYVADALNRRVLRLKLSYDCEARADIP